MNEILHANIFFFIASIATVCFSFFICYLLFQIIKIMQLIRSILEKIEAGSEVLASDLAHIRLFFSEGSFLTRILSFFGGGRKRSTRRNKED